MSRRRPAKPQQKRRLSAFERETQRRRAEMLKHISERKPRVHPSHINVLTRSP